MLDRLIWDMECECQKKYRESLKTPIKSADALLQFLVFCLKNDIQILELGALIYSTIPASPEILFR